MPSVKLNPQYDVVIVGGGPAGLAVAAAAAKAGRVLVAHRDAEIGVPVRTSGGSWLKSMTQFGIPSRYYQPIETITFLGPNDQAEIRFGEDKPVVMDVTGVYRLLAERAREAGAQIECGTCFAGLRDTGEEWMRVRLKALDHLEQLSARYVVDASGTCRAVVSALGALRRPRRFGLGAEIEFKNAGADASRAVLFVGATYCPSGYGWVFPTSYGTVRVGVGVIRPDTRQSPLELVHRFLQSATAASLNLKLGPMIERHTGAVPADGYAGILTWGRVMAVGDSASQALPLVGEGIRYCIESGAVAGQALAEALRHPDKARASLLEYETWWRRQYGWSFRVAQKVNLRMAAFDDADWDRTVRALASIPGDLFARALRMELSPLLLVRLLGHIGPKVLKVLW